MAAIRNLRLNLFQDADENKLVIHASYQLTFDVFEVIDENIYSELLTLYDEAEGGLDGKQIVLDFGTIKATASSIQRDVDILVSKKLFKNIDVYSFFSQLNGKISIQNLPNAVINNDIAPEIEGFVLN